MEDDVSTAVPPPSSSDILSRGFWDALSHLSVAAVLQKENSSLGGVMMMVGGWMVGCVDPSQPFLAAALGMNPPENAVCASNPLLQVLAGTMLEQKTGGSLP